MTVHFEVSGEASSGLLCRVLGLFAQLDLPAPELTVRLDGGRMALDARTAHFGDPLVSTVACKMARLVGVAAVRLEGETVLR